jgi:hypothetical protein
VSASQVSLSTWNIGFTQYLKEKYGYQGAVDCNADRASTAKAIVTSRLDGARAGKRKIVDTQWKPGVARITPVHSRRKGYSAANSVTTTASQGVPVQVCAQCPALWAFRRACMFEVSPT